MLSRCWENSIWGAGVGLNSLVGQQSTLWFVNDSLWDQNQERSQKSYLCVTDSVF